MLNNRKLIGTVIVLMASLLYVVFGMISKSSQNILSFNMLLFLQSISGFIASLILLYKARFNWNQLWSQFHITYLLRIIISLISMSTFIYGLKYVSLYNALIILNLCPFIMPLLRLIVFNHTIHRALYIPISLAFIGLTLILSPDRNIFSFPVLIVITSMLCMAFSVLLLEHKSNTNPSIALFYYFLISSLITASALMLSPYQQLTTWPYIGLGFISGILFFLVQLSITYAARYISTQLISILFYSEVIFALIASVYLGSIQLSLSLIFGTIFILIGSLGMLYFE